MCQLKSKYIQNCWLICYLNSHFMGIKESVWHIALLDHIAMMVEYNVMPPCLLLMSGCEYFNKSNTEISQRYSHQTVYIFTIISTFFLNCRGSKGHILFSQSCPRSNFNFFAKCLVIFMEVFFQFWKMMKAAGCHFWTVW